MFLSHTENAHKDRHEKHQPHVSIITSFNETKSTSFSFGILGQKNVSVRQTELLIESIIHIIMSKHIDIS